MPVPRDVVAATLVRLLGREPVGWSPRDEGAYSPSARWVVRFADGGTAFVKAEPEPRDEHGVAVEHRVYAAVDSPHVPRLLGYDPGPPAVLVTEDLSNARWGAPVTAADAVALRAAFDTVAALLPPPGLRRATGPRFGPQWPAYVADPAPLLATGLVDEAWAAAYLPVLAGAEAAADPRGDRLLHGDVWLQNWCRAERGVVIVDWASAYTGNPLAMRAHGEAAVRAAGGPPGHLLTEHPEWAAWLAGRAAAALAQEPPDADPRLVETESREALAALRWAADELGLPSPRPAPRYARLGPWRP